MNTTTRKYTINDIGCYGESSRGIYLGQHVQEIAKSHGMEIDPIGPWYEDTLITDEIASAMVNHSTVNAYEYGVRVGSNQANHAEEYDYRSDEALNWLNANMVEDDVFFEFFDGEFFLSSIHQCNNVRCCVYQGI